MMRGGFRRAPRQLRRLARLANSPGLKSFRFPRWRIKFSLERSSDLSHICLRAQPLKNSAGRVPQATLVADGLFDREGKFHVMRAGEQGDKTDAYLAGNHAALEQLFHARVIAILLEAGLLPADRARMLRGWVHSEFQVHQSRRIAANECQDIERLAQYIVRNPFSISKMQANRSDDSILYHSGMNAKIKRNFFIHASIHASIHAGVQRVRFHRAKYSSPLRSTFPTSAFRWCVTTAGIPTRCAVSAGSVQRRHRRRPRASPQQQQSRDVAPKETRRLKSSSISLSSRGAFHRDRGAS